MKRKAVIIVFIVLLAGVALLVWSGQRKAQRSEIYYSGTIEAKDANIAFQVSGRVSGVPVREGEKVRKDQVLAELDRQEFQARLDQAKATLERAIRGREQLESLLALYQTTLPADVDRAEAGLKNAGDVLAEARKNYERYEQLFSRGVVAERDRDAVKLHYETARSRLAESEALLRQAKGNLRRIEATRRDIEAAGAQIDAARAALDQATIQMQYTTLRAPFDGVITSRNLEPGEVVAPTREVLTLADLSRVDLKIFVGETEIGTVKPGQKAEVRIDTFPGKTFDGLVSFVSPEGEFTPKIIQTRKERVKLVYLVKITIPNPNLELKSGMPADAWLR
ncbi:MAG: efflux RND transporter periplasmic adaptor subunit [Deltaproteobacteria bacterium]|nr:efflux RND transporter periplasmic adaptor subunit [Deltaproteobacteria bacterium]